MRKTKIVCTIGPKSESLDMMEKLVLAGMNVMRMNFSHGDHEEQMKRIVNIRKINKKLGTHVATLLDTKGPEIRLGLMDGKIQFRTGDLVTVTPDEVLGTHERFQLEHL